MVKFLILEDDVVLSLQVIVAFKIKQFSVYGLVILI